MNLDRIDRHQRLGTEGTEIPPRRHIQSFPEGRSTMNRSILNVTCAFAALSLFVTAAHAACEDSPRVTGVPAGPQRDLMLKQCKDAGTNMHKTCDGIPACGAGGYPKETKAKFVSQIQICIN
jgi:hypothetical protein